MLKLFLEHTFCIQITRNRYFRIRT